MAMATLCQVDVGRIATSIGMPLPLHVSAIGRRCSLTFLVTEQQLRTFAPAVSDTAAEVARRL